MPYPYSQATFLNDQTFINYGGHTGTSTAFARSAAYYIAEMEMCTHLHTLLQPTDITGTYNWNAGNPFEMDYGNINIIYGVSVETSFNTTYVYTTTDLARAVLIRNAKYGIVDIASWPLMYQVQATSFPVSYLTPYNVYVSYNAGRGGATFRREKQQAKEKSSYYNT